MEKGLLVGEPPFPSRGIAQGLGQRGAELVDRVVKPQLRIGVDVLLHRSGQGPEKVAIVRAGKFQVIGMIESELAGGKVLRVMPPARVRTNLVNAAAAILLEERTPNVHRRVFKRRQREHRGRMFCQASHQMRKLESSEMAADVVNDQENLVRENIDMQRAAERATRTAGQLHSTLLDDPCVERIESGERMSRGAIEVVRRERSSDVVDELLSRVFRHRNAP